MPTGSDEREARTRAEGPVVGAGITPTAVTSERYSAAERSLSGRALGLARIAWSVLAVLTLGIFIVAVPAEFALLRTVCSPGDCAAGQVSEETIRVLQDLGLSLRSYAVYAIALDVVFAAGYGVVAVVLFWRRPEDPVALFVSLALFTFGAATFTNAMGALSAEASVWHLPVAFLKSVGSIAFGLLLFLFPDGRFVPRWTRFVAFAWILWQLPKYWFPRWIDSDPGSPIIWVALSVWTVALGTAVYAQSYRYRRVSGPKQRQQIKWVVFGISAGLVGFLGTNVAVGALSPVPDTPGAVFVHLAGHTISYAAMFLIPISIGVAVLRHHLFDIDLILNRTLVYGVLTACVVVLYVLVVGGLGQLLQVRGNLAVSLLATGIVAVVFAPLRDRLQRGANRLLYGERDEPYAVLSHLGDRLESTLAPDAVLPAVTQTVRETLKLPYAEIQLKRRAGFETAAASGDPVEDPLRLPLVYGGEAVGLLLLGPRAGEGGFADPERRLLENLAHQIGASAHAALMTDEALRLSADLQRSRERLVEAREEERRRLRRDLHDGLGPQLSSQALTIDAARALMRRDPDAAERLLLDLKADAQEAVADIRRLVYGLRPPALDDLGLLGALRETAAQYDAQGLNAELEAPDKLPQLSAAVEVAAYRIAQEALNNVARHAGAGHATVRLSLEAGALCVEVRDDGRGIQDPREDASLHAGVGLTSMRERATELGGSLLIEPLPAGGTRVRARLPAAKEE